MKQLLLNLIDASEIFLPLSTGEWKIIPLISFFPILLNLQCLCISVGVQKKLDIGNVQYSLVLRLIDDKLSDNKDIEYLIGGKKNGEKWLILDVSD